ncbi:MAG: DUF692 domain-containing protein [bacterium]|nr:DUF692 domain-containing protein [bacterium]
MTLPIFSLSKNSCGLGLHQEFRDQFLKDLPDIDFVEVHTENYMALGGIAPATLHRVREHYPISLHGVSLSLGSEEPLDQEYLKNLQRVVKTFEPVLVSEHLSWSRVAGRYLNDLLPLPYTQESLQIVCDHIDEVQNLLQRAILVENPSQYLSFKHTEMPETDFLKEMCQRTGCQLLLDVNNVYVSAKNNGFNAHHYLEAIPADLVSQIHLAGHEVREEGDLTLRIDTHGSEIIQDVWDLYSFVLDRLGPLPTLIERDSSIPPLPDLVSEVHQAKDILRKKTEPEKMVSHG